MSYISEKVAYLDGLADGMELGDDKYAKLFRGILDAMHAISEEIDDHDEYMEDLSDSIDDLYDEVEALDDAVFEDEDEDDDFLEVTCPECGETVYFDEDMLDAEDGLICPHCNHPIDIEICDAEECCDCCSDK